MKIKNFTGTETKRPRRFARDPSMVSRLGVYGASTAFASNNSFNVAWGGDSDPFSGVYDGRNILIHRIKAINEDADNLKRVHFWSNNETNLTTSGVNHLFSISMAKTKMTDGDGKLDVIINFPIPLLVMGGCRIGMKVSGGSNYAARVEIAYTVLNSTPDTASFEDLKYKYLSAFAFNGDEDAPVYAIKPDTATDKWDNDIEIWGGMIMNNKNAAGSNDYASTWVKNAYGTKIASISTLKGPTNAFRLDYPVGITMPSGTWPSLSGSWPSWSSGSLIPLTLPSFSGSFPSLNIGSIDSWGGVIWASNNTTNTPVTDDRKTWSLWPGGSDTEVVFFPFPIFCRGRTGVDGSDNPYSNMLVHTSGDEDENRTTWFYRPIKSKGADHGWV